MYFVENLWTVATYIFSVVSFTPLQDEGNNQIPFSGSPPSSIAVVPNTNSPDYPVFHPPTEGDKFPDFLCEYPDMDGWEDCSSPMNRKCWLRHKSDGTQLDINTDYENHWPKGIDRYVTLDIKDGWFAADGLNFTDAKLFKNNSDINSNYTYPGPWIQACWGDRLIINVTNSLRENGTSVHWHGIRQHNSVHMDGVNGVTQCPIAPGDYFVYNFTLKQYGSSWYHSHYSVQYADGAAGPITIHGPSSADWDDAISPPLIMTDWYHKSAFYVLHNGKDNGGKDILLNGRGNITKFDNSITAKTDIKPALNITFDPPKPGERIKKYLLRVINTSFDTTFVFSIDNHLLKVVSADFVPILPYSNTSILVGIGQRYNVIVEANPLGDDLDPYGNYWIRTQIVNCFRGSNQGDAGYDQTGILRYNKSSKLDPTSKQWSNIGLSCSDETYTSLSPVLPWIVGSPNNGELNSNSPRFGEEFDVYVAEPQRAKKDYPVAVFTLDDMGRGAPLRVDYSDPMFLHLNPRDQQRWPELWRVVPENFNDSSWVYLVIHGHREDQDNGTAGAHPIHLHGHDFAILEQAEHKKWNASDMNLKLINPPRRDVVLLPADGYVVIAFKADNPGPWLVHCHIATHISMGLGMQIFEDQPGAFNIWPDNDGAVTEAKRVCRNWNDWYENRTNWATDSRPFPIGNCSYNDPAWCFQDDSGV